MPEIATTSPSFVLARSRSSAPRAFSRLGERLRGLLAIGQAEVDPGDAGQRHVEVVSPGGRQSQRFLAEAFELAEELLLARQVDPGAGGGGRGPLRVDGQLGVGVLAGLDGGVRALPVRVGDVDREVFLMAVAVGGLQEEVGPRLGPRPSEHQGPVLGVAGVDPPARRPLLRLAVDRDLRDRRLPQVGERQVQVADAVLLRLDLGDLHGRRRRRPGRRGEDVVGPVGLLRLRGRQSRRPSSRPGPAS